MPETWLLETVQRVHRALRESSMPGELGARIPATLVSDQLHQFAWIGETTEKGVRVRATPDGVDLPDRLDVTGPSQTEDVSQTGEIQVTGSGESGEWQALRTHQSVPGAQRLVSVPLQTESELFGVLHLHTDCPCSPPAPAVLSELGYSIGIRFASLATEQHLARERRRLESFRSMVSHDIGNPLNIASGRLELATDDCDSDHLSHAVDAIERVDNLINQGVTFVQVGKPPEERDSISLAGLASDSWDDVGDDRGHLQTEEMTVHAERKRLRMLLNELFRNALAHSEGEITVVVGRLDDGSGFYVADTGPGIPEDDREYVFDMGYTTESDRAGNGLTIVQEIASAHGWSVRLGSPESDGTRVEIITDRWTV